MIQNCQVETHRDSPQISMLNIDLVAAVILKTFYSLDPVYLQLKKDVDFVVPFLALSERLFNLVVVVEVDVDDDDLVQAFDGPSFVLLWAIRKTIKHQKVIPLVRSVYYCSL